MKEPYRVLVFPCGTEIGLEIHRALQWTPHVELFGASSVHSNHGRFVYKNYLEGLPFANDPALVPHVKDIVRELNIGFLIPAHDDATVTLAGAAEELGCRVVGSPAATSILCRSKRSTYNHLKGHVRVPHMLDVGDDLKFPVFVKPDVGQGSKGAYRIDTRDALDFQLATQHDLLVLEYLPGSEYTVDCFTDRHRVLQFVGPRKRIRMQGGISVHSEPLADPVMERLVGDIAAKINAAMELRGGWFFQLKTAGSGELVLLEVGVRTAGTSGLARGLGINLPLLSLYDAAGNDVSIPERPPVSGFEVDRALESRFNFEWKYNHAYVDLDDSLLVRNEVNTLLVSFLYQCLNKGVQTHLVTRHSGDVATTLKRHRLHGIFDSVTYSPAGTSKADYIQHLDAIFVDDSFAERQSVAKKCKIPVFSVDQVEALIDWRR